MLSSSAPASYTLTMHQPINNLLFTHNFVIPPCLQPKTHPQKFWRWIAHHISVYTVFNQLWFGLCRGGLPRPADGSDVFPSSPLTHGPHCDRKLQALVEQTEIVHMSPSRQVSWILRSDLLNDKVRFCWTRYLLTSNSLCSVLCLGEKVSLARVVAQIQRAQSIKA